MKSPYREGLVKPEVESNERCAGCEMGCLRNGRCGEGEGVTYTRKSPSRRCGYPTGWRRSRASLTFFVSVRGVKGFIMNCLSSVIISRRTISSSV